MGTPHATGRPARQPSRDADPPARDRGPVTVPGWHRNVRGLLYPAALWLLLRGGRKLCKAGQACARLVPFAVPLPLPLSDIDDLLTRPVV